MQHLALLIAIVNVALEIIKFLARLRVALVLIERLTDLLAVRVEELLAALGRLVTAIGRVTTPTAIGLLRFLLGLGVLEQVLEHSDERPVVILLVQ